MAEQEVDTEHLHEVIREHGHHTAWGEKVALTTALLALLAAVSNLMSAHEADESMRHKIEASNQWSYYQAKSIKSMLTQDAAERGRYQNEEKEIQQKAEEHDIASRHSTHVHEFYAFAVTIFQVATAIGAIGVLVRKKLFWYTSLVLGVVGIVLFMKALLMS
jgi:hypothetical protein